MKKFLFLFLMTSILVSCFSTIKSEDKLSKDEVIAAVQAFDLGWESKNVKNVDRVLNSNYIYFTPSGGIFIRDSIIATAEPGSSYKLSEMKRIIIGVKITGNTAIVDTRWKGIGSYRGFPFDDDQRCSITVIKREGKVQFLSEHCSSIK